jgi:hypothetical protein
MRRQTMETLNKSFDRLNASGKMLIPFVVSLSNHEWNQLVQRLSGLTIRDAVNDVQ